MKIIVLILFLLNISIFAQKKAIISGTDLNFAEFKTDIKKFDGVITSNQKVLKEVKFNENGEFLSEIEIDNPTEIFIDFGVFRGYLYIEPGNKYDIILPPKQLKTKEEENNPFFNPIEIDFITKAQDSLNISIRKIDSILYDFYDVMIGNIFNPLNIDTINKFLNSLNNISSNNKYVNTYKYLTKGYIILSGQRKSAEWAYKYLENTTSEVINNNAFPRFFNFAFKNYIKINYNDSSFLNLLTKGKLREIDSVFRKILEPENENLFRLTISKILYDAYYDPLIGEEVVSPTLIKLGEYTEKFDCHNEALKIIDKVSKLESGDKAIPISAMDSLGNNKLLLDTISNYTYLAFLKDNDYTSLRDYKELEIYKERFGIYLDIVVIIVNYKNLSNCKIPIFRIEKNNSSLNDYNINYFPKYILIDKNGFILNEEAPSPHENFERYFWEIIKHKENIN